MFAYICVCVCARVYSTLFMCIYVCVRLNFCASVFAYIFYSCVCMSVFAFVHICVCSLIFLCVYFHY